MDMREATDATRIGQIPSPLAQLPYLDSTSVARTAEGIELRHIAAVAHEAVGEPSLATVQWFNDQAALYVFVSAVSLLSKGVHLSHHQSAADTRHQI